MLNVNFIIDIISAVFAIRLRQPYNKQNGFEDNQWNIMY